MRNATCAQVSFAIALMALALSGCMELMDDEMLLDDDMGALEQSLNSPIGFHDSSTIVWGTDGRQRGVPSWCRWFKRDL